MLKLIRDKPSKKDPETLWRYLQVLVEAFPSPLTQEKLATKAGVSLSAVSKVKINLRGFCDVYSLLDRRFVLKKDLNTFTELFLLFLGLGKRLTILRAAYAKAVIDYEDVHRYITEKAPFYAQYFDTEDTAVMLEVLFHNLGHLSIGPSKLTCLSLPSFLNEVLFELVSNFELPPLDKNGFLRLLELRDRFHVLIMQLVNDELGGLSIFDQVADESQRRLYYTVYTKTIEHYLQKFFASWADYVVAVAEKRGIAIDKDYSTIRSLTKDVSRANI
jgi:hypothetical protein